MSAISNSGREFSKWCSIADEPKNTARFMRLMRRERRDRLGELLDEELARAGLPESETHG